jgi:hypothetical protein
MAPASWSNSSAACAASGAAGGGTGSMRRRSSGVMFLSSPAMTSSRWRTMAWYTARANSRTSNVTASLPAKPTSTVRTMRLRSALRSATSSSRPSSCRCPSSSYTSGKVFTSVSLPSPTRPTLKSRGPCRDSRARSTPGMRGRPLSSSSRWGKSNVHALATMAGRAYWPTASSDSPIVRARSRNMATASPAEIRADMTPPTASVHTRSWRVTRLFSPSSSRGRGMTLTWMP